MNIDKIWHHSDIKTLEEKVVIPQGHYADATLKNEAPDLSTVKKWTVEFRKRKESLDDSPRIARHATTTTEGNIDRVHQIVMNDRSLTINQIAYRVRELRIFCSTNLA